MNLSYRDEVPPVPQKKQVKLFSLTPKTLMWVGIGVAVIVAGIIMLMVSTSNNIAPQMQRLSARLDTTLSITEDASRSIQNADLRKLNSDARILTTGSISKLQQPFANAGMGSVPENILAAEADTATVERIEAAKTGGNFDGIYARVLEQKIDTILALMIEIFDNTNRSELQTALTESYNDFTALRDQLRELDL